MRSTTQTYKDILASGERRRYALKIDLTLADNTVLHLTGADIWADSFGIDTASSGTSSFDIGSAVIGKCKFTINNIDGDYDGYDFFNAEAVVWIGLIGDTVGNVQQYHRMGFYTVDEPEKANGLISLTLLDYMWKFDVPLSEVTLNYPVTALTAVQTICTYCGVQLAATSANFHGYNFSIAEAPKDAENMNCREMLQYIAMIGCNFCTMSDQGQLEFKWYDNSALNTFDYNQSTTLGTEDIEITGVKFVIDKTEYSIGSAGYVLELQNPLVNASNVNSVLNLIWDVLEGFTLRTFNLTTASDLAVEIGDKCKIKDYKGNYVYSWVTTNSFKLAAHLMQCNAEPPNRTLVKRYSQAVKAAVEVARREASDVISNYDLAVQMMNNLAVNAMGGYEEYEDLPTGGRVWYLSNRPITKSAQGVCSFEAGSTVYKKSGDGFFVSRDGGLTWVNGYNMSTGELVVNVLDAIGINFDWARGGTLTLGGYGNGNGVLSIQDSSNLEKIHGDNTGLSVGAVTGSKIFINTLGEMLYYFNNVYSGKLRMKAKNYGTQSNPDIRDTFSVEDFNDVEINADEYARVHIANITNGSSHNGSVYITANDGTDESYIEVLPDGIYFHGDLKPAVNLTGESMVLTYVGADGNLYECDFTSGLLTGHEQGEGGFGSTWHTWESDNVTYTAIILPVGATTAQFPSTDSNLAYEPFIQCASGVEPPMLEGISFSGGTCTVRFTAVTSAQAGGGSDCVIKLRKFM